MFCLESSLYMQTSVNIGYTDYVHQWCLWSWPFSPFNTCHKLWTEICDIRQIFKGELIKFCEIFPKITLKLFQNSQKPLFKCIKLVINTAKCDVCLFLHKICCKMVWKFCKIWKIFRELDSRWAKFCEISSRNVRYGMCYLYLCPCRHDITPHKAIFNLSFLKKVFFFWFSYCLQNASICCTVKSQQEITRNFTITNMEECKLQSTTGYTEWIWTAEKIAVMILKFKHCSFTIE